MRHWAQSQRDLGPCAPTWPTHRALGGRCEQAVKRRLGRAPRQPGLRTDRSMLPGPGQGLLCEPSAKEGRSPTWTACVFAGDQKLMSCPSPGSSSLSWTLRWTLHVKRRRKAGVGGRGLSALSWGHSSARAGAHFLVPRGVYAPGVGTQDAGGAATVPAGGPGLRG